jgi:hypothetical protein
MRTYPAIHAALLEDVLIRTWCAACCKVRVASWKEAGFCAKEAC